MTSRSYASPSKAASQIAVVRRTVGWRSFRKRFLMNRKSSLYPGVDGTGVEGRGVSEPLAAGTARSVPLRGGVCRTLAAGTARSVLVRGGSVERLRLEPQGWSR